MSQKKNVFFGFLPPTNENKIKILKSHFLGRNFVFIQIAYIIFVKEGFVWNGVNTPKNVEKHVIYDFFQKKYIVAITSVFCLFFDENNEISRKSSKKFTFSEKSNFFREMAYIFFFSELNKR